ncbi:hypothetical protein BDV38DRAFT_289020 [Aspergillus pseudotamarii]|uniref:Uncharacterized protein n=1 Tax=Aspergillus pseudotamarii TaxID=132259 RepID=A0A5N6SCJ2_ASPPS|nr:uncharacterized protein BDV38DRAFT_289020 [Aspergillus pseudotamarii]KAE8131103.1 hypothetical protein BDV38DRAFT_289020 [Aspergillus pseudotamarii]
MLDRQNFITADHIDEEVKKAYTLPITSLDLIVDESTLNFRHELHQIPPISTPEADFSGDSESDDPPTTLTESASPSPTFAALSSRGKSESLTSTISGGAVVSNLSLVVPGKRGKRFADLPVVSIKGSNNVNAQLLATVPGRRRRKQNQVPVLLLPEEGNHVLLDQAVNGDLPGGAMPVWNSIKRTRPDAMQHIFKTNMDKYVLSGDIKNFFGIKGLHAKIYKFKGPGMDNGKQSADNTECDTADHTAGETSGDNKTEENKEPVREKIKLNPDSLALKGQPLGTLFPFIDDEDLKKIPITNLEFTYCEEKQGTFFLPGLRLEVDVMLKDSLQWASDTLKTIFGDQPIPESIHLSAHLGDKRDWTKRPVIEKLVLQGYFPTIGLKIWDVLQFKTIGIEITGTKAGRSIKPTPEKEGKNGTHEAKDPSSDDASKDKPKASTEEYETKPDPDGKRKTNPQSDDKDRTEPDLAMSEKNESEADGKEKINPKTDEPDKPSTGEDREGKTGEDKKEDEKPKSKEKKSWNFGFGFFGTLILTNVPHANAPVELNYRIARDFETDGSGGDDGDVLADDQAPEDKPEDDTKQKAESITTSATKTEEQNGKELVKGGSKNPATKAPEQKKPTKQYSDGEHRRIWNMVIWCDEWEDIYGIKNVSLTKAELKTSFEQGKFAETAKLDLEANLSLGNGTFTVTGKISRDENFLDAQVGDLTLSDIKKIHAQIAGRELPVVADTEADAMAEAKGNEITFKKLHLNLSSTKVGGSTDRSLQLDGEVTFNEHSSASALIKIDQDGVTINGDIQEFNIPDTHLTIKKAGLHIYIAFKQGQKKEKAVKGGKGQKDSKATTDKPDESEKPENEFEKPAEEPKKSDQRETKPDDRDKGEDANGDKAITKPEDEKETAEDKPEVNKRASQFSILGTVQIENFTVTVGLHIEQKKDKQNRDWILVGTVESIRLNELWADVKGGFLDLELDNVTLIASSEEREKQEISSTSTADSWDILAKIDSYGYPVVKGVQLCASIRKFEKLDQLNNKKKVDGLLLAVAFPSKGKLQISIDMPKTLEIPLRDYAKLGGFGAAIIAGDAGPILQLNATLTLLFDDQPPIRVRGYINGDIERAEGGLYMAAEDRWINPFKLNKKAVVSKLGIGAGFKYATVWAQGPDRLMATGRLELGNDFHAEMDLSLGTGKDLVINVDISEINVVKLVRLAGELADVQALKNIQGGDDILVFRAVKLYMSRGGKIFDVEYERGIIIKGKVEFFGKTGDFDGRFTDDGVIIKAGIDQFNIGGLEVTSASVGGKRATLDVEMTKTKQSILVDGMIRYQDFHASIFIDADMQERRLDANIDIKFIEQLSFKLKAKVRVPQGNKLDGLVAKFEAELTPDVAGAIFDGIKNGIDAIGKAATQTIDDAINDLEGQISENNAELHRLQERVDQLKIESGTEIRKREAQIKSDNSELTKLRKELEKLGEDVKKAEDEKNRNDSDIARRMVEKEAAERKLQNKIREMSSEYDRKLKEQQDNQRRWEMEKERLENEKNSRWGEVIRSGAAAEITWKVFDKKVGDAYWWKNKCWERHDDAAWYNKYGTWIIFLGASAELERAKGQRDFYATTMNAAKDLMNTSEYKEVENAITQASNKITNFSRAVDALNRKGVIGYAQEMCRDEEAERDRQIQLLTELETESRRLVAALTEAKTELENNRGRITTAQRKAQSAIAQLEEEIKLKPFDLELRAKQIEHANVNAQVQTIQQTLKDIRNGIDAGTQAAKHTVETLKKGMPRVTLIIVKASTESFIKNEPLVFSCDIEWLGENSNLEVTWAPGMNAADLYKDIADKIIKHN